jgi:hypothetical protein
VRTSIRWASAGGILYVVLFVVGAILMLRGPLGDEPPPEVISYFRNSDHRDRIFVGWLLVVIGVFFLVWFLAGLRETVRRLTGDGVLLTVTTIGGAVYAALTLVAASVWAAIFTMSDDTYRHEVYPGLIHAASDAGYVLHSAGGAAMGAMIVAVSIAALTARAIPTWAGWLSFIAGIAAVFSIFFVPWFVIAVWLVVASLLVTRVLGASPRAAAVARSHPACCGTLLLPA